LIECRRLLILFERQDDGEPSSWPQALVIPQVTTAYVLNSENRRLCGWKQSNHFRAEKAEKAVQPDDICASVTTGDIDRILNW
jgi:hypothetical protein